MDDISAKFERSSKLSHITEFITVYRLPWNIQRCKTFSNKSIIGTVSETAMENWNIQEKQSMFLSFQKNGSVWWYQF